MADESGRKKLGKRIVPYVTKVALVDNAANGETTLLAKRDAPPDLDPAIAALPHELRPPEKAVAPSFGVEEQALRDLIERLSR